ncbi:MAG: aldo/keto reductase [Candidatus Sungbacteria bacterium]|nr:aldo/keto reductase [Candidatus Sungbacteria bacterium]
MQTKTLGRTGIKVSIIGLGGANLGLPTSKAPYYQHVDNPEHNAYMVESLGIATVHAALRRGVTLIDTAPKYGYGMSEQIIGKALRMRPNLARNCMVTTKVGLVYAGDGFDYSHETTMECMFSSSVRLGMERFSIVYLHDPMDFPMDFVMSESGAMGALRELQRRGIVRYIGIAADEPETAADYIETGEFDVATVSGAWSLINQKAAERILPAARKHNVGIVATTVIERGLLATGKPIPGVRYIQRDFSPELLAHVETIDALCHEFDIPLLAAALQWATRDPQIATAIPGARTPEEARENALAGMMYIPESFWKVLESLIRHFDTRV